jgi:hypothetical protein
MADSGLRMDAGRAAKLARDMDEAECKRRNALSQTKPGFLLKSGQKLSVVETFGGNEAYLVEVPDSRPDSTAWMGVVYPAEIELT